MPSHDKGDGMGSVWLTPRPTTIYNDIVGYNGNVGYNDNVGLQRHN